MTISLGCPLPEKYVVDSLCMNADLCRNWVLLSLNGDFCKAAMAFILAIHV